LTDSKEKVIPNAEHEEEDFNLHLPEYSTMLKVPAAAPNVNHSRIDMSISPSLFNTELPAESLPTPRVAYGTRGQEAVVEKMQSAAEGTAGAQKKGGDEEEKLEEGGSCRKEEYEEVRADELDYSRVENDWYSVVTRMEEERKVRMQKEAGMGS
jgi:hypothetical protein